MRRANPRSSMLHRLVADAKLAQVEPNHLRLDLDLVEFLAAVDTDDAADHLGHDDHVAQVRLDQIGLLVGLGGLFRLAQFLDQAHGLALEAAVEAAAGAGVDDVAELFGGEVEESAKEFDVSACPQSMVGKAPVRRRSRLVMGLQIEQNKTYWSRSMPR